MSGKFESINPATEEVLESFSEHSTVEVEARLCKSLKAQKDWARQSLEGRLECLKNFGQELGRAEQSLARKLSLEMGKPIKQSQAELEKSRRLCEYYLKISEDALAPRLLDFSSHKAEIHLRPLGPLLGIMPWNFPVWQVLRFSIPNLVLGNSILVKHAESVCGTALLLESIFLKSFGPGLYQSLILGRERIPELIGDSRIRAVSLTGSGRAGSAVAKLAGEHLKKTLLELGGSDPYLILEDAELKAAAKACAMSRLTNTGQSCVSAKRFIIHESVYEEFKSHLIEEFQNYKMGDPLDESVNLGPLARSDLREQIQVQIEKSMGLGAKLVWASDDRFDRGFFYPSKVIENVRPGMPAFDDEVFGPVASLIKARSDSEVIELANQSKFGLGSAIFSRDIERAKNLARDELEVGMVAINDFLRSQPGLPFGGVKESGFGRELGQEAFAEFSNVKLLSIHSN
ncbi:MAG: aldehyde dehydrogenase family protein [Bradymonadales bacterium]|nr:MAG: aldehyde dehydrogenase family protein [Bradymonadales bacterium]